MKTNKFITTVIFILLAASSVTGQDKAKALSINSCVWFGIDFTGAKFTSVTEDPAIIVSQYLNAINSLVLNEPEKYDLKKFFKKTEVITDIETATERNSQIDPKELVVSQAHTITPEDVKKIIGRYRNADNTGAGLIFVAENLNKSTQTGSYYVCFFDIASHDIIDCQRMTGKAAGFGFRNYWAGSVYNVMKNWAASK
jgi:hypothetical protein